MRQEILKERFAVDLLSYQQRVICADQAAFVEEHYGVNDIVDKMTKIGPRKTIYMK